MADSKSTPKPPSKMPRTPPPGFGIPENEGSWWYKRKAKKKAKAEAESRGSA